MRNQCWRYCCGFFLNKAAKDELCTKQTEDHLGCQPAQYLSIGLMAYGTLGLIHSAYEARSSNSNDSSDDDKKMELLNLKNDHHSHMQKWQRFIDNGFQGGEEKLNEFHQEAIDINRRAKKLKEKF